MLNFTAIDLQLYTRYSRLRESHFWGHKVLLMNFMSSYHVDTHTSTKCFNALYMAVFMKLV